VSATDRDRARTRARHRSPGSWRRYRGLLAAAGIVGAAALAFAFVPGVVSRQFRSSGPAQGELISRAELRDLAFTVVAQDEETVSDARWTLDGEDVTEQTTRDGTRATFWGRSLSDGEHVLEVVAGSVVTFRKTRHTWRFTVDTTPPVITVGASRLAGRNGEPYVLRGTVEDGVSLKLDGEVLAAPGGRFSVRYEEPPTRQIVLAAEDAAGNRITRIVTVSVAPRTTQPPIRGIHVTAIAWRTDFLREPILELIDQGLVTTVQIDLKDEGGEIGYDSELPLAQKVGAVRGYYDLDELVELLHSKGIRIVGRVVAFRDPIYAAWAWDHGRRGQVVQTPKGEPYAGYGGFTNFAHPAVQRYNIDIAVEAARRGVDDILYDYVRRPDGPVETMRFPRIGNDTPEGAIVGFLARTRRQLESYGTFIGASVFGVAATRPEDVAQDVARMASEVDYIAPLVYPSHWGKGEYGVADPNAEPFDIVLRSLKDFRRAIDGKGARLVPWLQAFSLGVEYGPREVQAQIDAASQLDVHEWIMWDPLCTYSPGIFPVEPRTG
jgi:hypothetical protein